LPGGKKKPVVEGGGKTKNKTYHWGGGGILRCGLRGQGEKRVAKLKDHTKKEKWTTLGCPKKTHLHGKEGGKNSTRKGKEKNKGGPAGGCAGQCYGGKKKIKYRLLGGLILRKKGPVEWDSGG